MTGIYYAAVEDDPLTSGEGSRVFASGRTSTIHGKDGKRRRLVFIGDKAYCSKCQSEGVIIGGAGVRQNGRLIDSQHGGRRQAVGGDQVSCRCPISPQIIAIYGRSWRITDRGEASQQAASSATYESESYDQRFILTDERTGKPIANMPYRIVTEGGVSIDDRTDLQGHTAKVSSARAVTATVHIFEQSPPLNPDWDKYL